MSESFFTKLKTIQESLEDGEKVFIYKTIRHAHNGKCDKYAVTKDRVDCIQPVFNQKGNVLDEYEKAKTKLKQRELNGLNNKDRSN